MKGLQKYNFAKGDSEWHFEEEISEIVGFIESKANFNDYVAFWVEERDLVNNDYFDKPQEFQENAFNYFVKNTDLIFDSICNGIIEYYPKLMKQYKVTDYNAQFGFPELKSISDVKNLISIDAVHIIGQGKNNYGYIGVQGSCSWNPEHGFGVIMHKDRVVAIGDADTAFSNHYYIIRKDIMTPEEWKAYKKELKRRKAENLAKAQKEYEEKLQRELEEKEAALKKKWWKFWK